MSASYFADTKIGFKTSLSEAPGTHFLVIYRTGGRERCKWHQVLGRYATRTAADACVAEIKRMGYYAEVRSPESLRHGLPESWGVGKEIS